MYYRLTSLFFITLFSLAQANMIRPLLQISFEGGGDELVTIQHDYESDYTIDAGDGLTFEAGVAMDDPASNLEMQFLVGYKFDTDDADNGDITWSTIPLSALAFVKVEDFKFGGGITYHLSPELDGRFGREEINHEFESAWGGVLQAQYSFEDTFAIGVKATFIDYTLKGDNTQTANGNTIGIVGTFKFGGTRSRYR
jgi:hypothetical protein